MHSIEHYCNVLHALHASLPTNSQEREALEIAAQALIFSFAKDDFHAFLSNDELTTEQKEHLTRLGLDW